MANVDLNIIAKFRDQVSRPIEKVQSRVSKLGDAVKANLLKIAAATYSMKKAFDVAEMGAKAEQIERSFALMAQSVGINAEMMKKALMEASAWTINFSNVASQVSALMAQGLGFDEIVALMRQARVEAKLFGKTTEESFRVIASAITGGLVTTLRRSYGLQLSLEQAVEDYAKATGKSVEEVKKFYMAQALANHILEQSKSHLEAVNLEMMSNYEQIQRLKSMWIGFWETVGQILLRLWGAIVTGLQMIRISFAKIGNWIRSFLIFFMRMLEKMYGLLARIPKIGKFFAFVRDQITKLRKSLEADNRIMQNVINNWSIKAMATWELVIPKAQESASVVKKQAEIIGKALRQQSEAVGNAIKDEVEILRQDFKEVSNDIVQMSESAAERIQAVFGDYLYNVLSGKVRGIKGLFRSLGDTILRMFTEKLSVKLFDFLGIGSFFNSFLGGVFGHQLGTDYIPKTGLYLLHKGERVVPSHEANGANVGINVVVNQYIQSWDAQDVWRNRKMLASAISEEIKNNTALRGVIKRYG